MLRFAHRWSAFAIREAHASTLSELSRFHGARGNLGRAGQYLREAILSDGVAAGVFRAVDPAVARNSVLSALNAVTLWYVPGGPLSVDDVGHEICDLVICGLRG